MRLFRKIGFSASAPELVGVGEIALHRHLLIVVGLDFSGGRVGSKNADFIVEKSSANLDHFGSRDSACICRRLAVDGWNVFVSIAKLLPANDRVLHSDFRVFHAESLAQ